MIILTHYELVALTLLIMTGNDLVSTVPSRILSLCNEPHSRITTLGSSRYLGREMGFRLLTFMNMKITDRILGCNSA
jgi:hypothetical protein